MNRPISRRAIALAAALGLLAAGACERRQHSDVPPEQSRLKAATDVFWSLQKIGYIAAKQKPPTSSHGCKPFEYLARKGEAQFRISVFECPTADKAAEIVDHPYSRHVDALLRNHHEGGILRRGSLQIIVRKTRGAPDAADELLEALGTM